MALSVREKLQSFYGVEVDLVPGRGGVFEILEGTRLLFSKKLEGGFPSNKQLETLAIKSNK